MEAVITNITFPEVLGISAPVEYTYIALQILVFMIGATGNSLIIFAALKYKALNMDKPTLVLVEHIAFSDLFLVVFVFGVVTVNLICRRWMFGPAMCLIIGYSKHVAFNAEFCFIVLIGLIKLYSLVNPLSPLSVELVTKSVVVIWVLSVLWVATWPIYSTDMVYNPLFAMCMPRLYPKPNCVLVAFQSTVTTAIILTNLAILAVARRYSKNGRILKATKTVSLICWVFIVSYGPWIGIWGLEAARKEIPLNLAMVGLVSVQINLVGNPLVYSFTNQRFFLFTKGLFHLTTPSVPDPPKKRSTASTRSTGLQSAKHFHGEIIQHCPANTTSCNKMSSSL